MMDDKRLISDYKKMQDEAAPDLWERIEAELQPVSRQEPSSERSTECSREASGVRQIDELSKRRFRPRYGAAAAAAVVCLVMAARLLAGPGTWDSNQALDAAGTTMAAEAAAPEAAAADSRQLQSNERMLSLSAGALAIPAEAVTAPADGQYFSEGILSETDLLTGAEVMAVSFAYDESGKAVKVLYDITVSGIYYAEDYMAEAETMQISSPIIAAGADEAYVLYQMQVGETYLLPLKAADGGFELLYPFAPQIQLIGEQNYLFHSGYASLINEQTMVAQGEKEGENDFFYDRMLSRSDDTFLSELILLVN